MEAIGHLHAPVALSPDKDLLIPLNERLDGDHSQTNDALDMRYLPALLPGI
jgi:hypothetical protein